MKRLVLSAVAAAALVGSAYSLTAFAATDPPDGAAAHEKGDSGFMLDAKLAGMKAALKLTPEQDKLWAPFEAAVRDGRRRGGRPCASGATSAKATSAPRLSP